MSHDSHDAFDVLRDLREARWKARRRLAVTLGLNLALAAIFLLFPWWRGRRRAADARAGFAELSACLLGGAAVADPGLALPRGAWDRLAYLALDDSSRGRSWPARCLEKVDAVSPPGDPPTLVLPWVRSAEVELDETLPRLRAALARLTRARRRGPLAVVPSELPTELERLVAKLAHLSTEAGVTDLERPALDDRRFATLAQSARPTRVFLGYRGDTSLRLRLAGPRALHLVLWDRSRTGSASVTSRGPREHRVLATPPAWGPLLDETQRWWLVRISRREQCGDACDRRATGLAPLDVVSGRVGPVRWLRGAVVGRPDRGMLVVGDAVQLLAGSGPLLRLLVLDAERGERRASYRLEGFGRAPATQADPPGALVMAGDARRTVVLDAGRFDPPAAPPVADDDDADPPDAPAPDPPAPPPAPVRAPRVAVLDAAGFRVLPPLEPVPGERPWALACRAQTRTWLVVGSERAVRLATLDDDSDQPASGPLYGLGVRDGFALDDPDGDAARLRCDAEGATLALSGPEGRGVVAMTCRGGASRCAQRSLEDVGAATQWDLARTGRGHVVAWSAARSGAQIRVQPLDAELRPLAPPVAPSVCWEPERGLCGRPHLLVAGDDVLVAAALSASVVVLQSDASARRWVGFGER